MTRAGDHRVLVHHGGARSRRARAGGPRRAASRSRPERAMPACSGPIRRAGVRPDGVRMAILASRLDTIARKMANTLFRTARSGVLNSGHDFSCVDPDRRLPPARRRREPADPRHDRAGPDDPRGQGVPSRAPARRRLPPQLALSRQLAPGRPVHHRAADRRGGRAPLLAAVQGAPGRLRQLGADHLHGPRPRRLRGGRADLSRRRGPARLPRRRRHHPHVHDPDPRARAVVGRLSGGARRGADRRARAAGARARGRLGHARAACRGLARLFRAAHDPGDPPPAERARGGPRPATIPFPGRAGRHPARDRRRGPRRGRRGSWSTCATTPTASRAGST